MGRIISNDKVLFVNSDNKTSIGGGGVCLYLDHCIRKGVPLFEPLYRRVPLFGPLYRGRGCLYLDHCIGVPLFGPLYQGVPLFGPLYRRGYLYLDHCIGGGCLYLDHCEHLLYHSDSPRENGTVQMWPHGGNGSHWPKYLYTMHQVIVKLRSFMFFEINN